jgi:hypothetical protein
MRYPRCTAALLACLVLTGCVQQGKASKPVVKSSARTSTAVAVSPQFGKRIHLDSSISVLVSDPGIQPSGTGVALKLTVRADNSGTDPGVTPVLAIQCSGLSYLGRYSGDSSYHLQDTLAPHTYKEGSLFLLLPGDQGAGTAVPQCGNPASIVVESAPGVASSAQMHIPLTPETVAALNARRQR